LDSPGISVINELNNIEETSSLVEDLRHVFHQGYKDAHNDKDNNKKLT
jgi:hypothetical protein